MRKLKESIICDFKCESVFTQLLLMGDLDFPMALLKCLSIECH